VEVAFLKSDAKIRRFYFSAKLFVNIFSKNFHGSIIIPIFVP
jgi:hypothetical protein